MSEEIVRYLWQASESKKACRVTLKGEPFPRVIHPYGVCKSSANKIIVVCKQSAGFTKGGGGAGYRNILLAKITEVEIIEEHFSVLEDFDPNDSQYVEWVYHI
ncbi:MAG: hypothetical protein ABJG78_17270 [Cyclobacteriaceae bacterium]